MNAENSSYSQSASIKGPAAKTLRMTGAERRATGALAGIFALRMFGLFLVLPVLAVYARDLPGATPLAIGLAVGVYGACQAIFQIPFGLASDRFGRKLVITVGLIILIVGSLIAASAETMGMLIVGRALQGAGAIAAAVLALTSDLTRDDVRTRSMALVGVSIGAAFILALIAGPALAASTGVAGLFLITAALGVCAITVLWLIVPDTPRVTAPERARHGGSLFHVLADPRLLSLDFGMFLLHATLMAVFVVVPVWLVDRFQWDLTTHWKLYLPVLLLSVPAFAIMVRQSHQHGRTRPTLLLCITLLLVSVGLLTFGGQQFWLLAAALTIFFCGFNTLEALLPSLVSRLAPAQDKGAALGAFNTAQFLGIFCGGLLGGVLLERGGGGLVFAVFAVGLGVWLVWTRFGLQLAPVSAARPLKSIEIRIGARTPSEAEALRQRLSGYDGVAKVTVNPIEGLAQLEVDPERFDMRLLDEFAETVNIRIR